MYTKYGLTKRTIMHCLQVKKLCRVISSMLDLKYNQSLLFNAALLHDLGACVYPKGKKDLTDFELVWGHQVKTREILKKESGSLIAKTASNHNIHGLTIKESKRWGYSKGISLTPKSVESKILAFSDSLRSKYVHNSDCITINHPKYRFLLKKYGMLLKAENRKKRLLNYLISHGMDYEKILKQI